MEQFQVSGNLGIWKRQSVDEKQQLIESQIEHYRKTPVSFWYDVPMLEVLAAAIWRSASTSPETSPEECRAIALRVTQTARSKEEARSS
jgi:hypothetical protein